MSRRVMLRRVLPIAGLVAIAVLVAFGLRSPARGRVPAYTAEFYETTREDKVSTIAVVVPIVMELVHPGRLLDVGCGTGLWLKAFQNSGVGHVAGIDGPWVARKALQIDPRWFTAADLNTAAVRPGRFDLAMSLEVAEHLKPETGPKLVELLTASAPVVLFSAAMPGQGGVEHINEQWPGYWRELFRRRDYTLVDALRPRILQDRRVAWYYRQNLVLYCSNKLLPERPDLNAASVPDASPAFEWVHRRTVLHPAKPAPPLAVRMVRRLFGQ